MNGDESVYAIRLRRRAQTDTQQILAHLAEVTDADRAAAWYEGLQDALATLATFPRHLPLAEEGRFFRDDVRFLLYQHTPGGAKYRILYTIAEADEDAAFVYVLHIRHGARRPMTRAEAREIETED